MPDLLSGKLLGTPTVSNPCQTGSGESRDTHPPSRVPNRRARNLIRYATLGLPTRFLLPEDHILVRIRATGHPELTKSFGSYEEAELFETEVLTGRSA